MVVFLASSSLWNNPMVAAQWGVVLAASLAAAIVDARTHRIPNKLTLPLVGAGLVWAGSIGGIGGLIEGTLACVLLAAPFVILFLGGGGGAGDAKLMAGVGAWLGLFNGIMTLVAVVVMGAILGLLLALVKGRFWHVLYQVRVLATRFSLIALSGKGAALATGTFDQEAEKDFLPMPYGVAIFCGVAVAALGALLWHLPTQ